MIGAYVFKNVTKIGEWGNVKSFCDLIVFYGSVLLKKELQIDLCIWRKGWQRIHDFFEPNLICVVIASPNREKAAAVGT